MRSAFVIPTASAALAVLAVTPATAAPPAIYNWTGCYIGVNAGGGLMRDSFTDSSNGTGGTGGVAGGQVGCNYQSGMAVFGVEGEGYWSGIKDSMSENGPFSSFERDARNKYDFSIAGRLGAAFDRTLIYGKAGWVWGQFDFGQTVVCCGSTPSVESLSKSGTLDGLLLGVGVEHALTRNWTVKLEYNYLNYGARAFTQTSCVNSVCAVTGTSSDSATKHIFKVGANYLINWP
jgi:outer membrane immunogenic protein